MEHRVSSIKTIDIVQISLMAAITFIATSVIHFPSSMGVLHLGDSMIFLSAILFGRKKSAISSAVLSELWVFHNIKMSRQFIHYHLIFISKQIN